LRDAYNVPQNEKVCYLGKGCFGIVQFRPNSSPLRFIIRQRIQYEENDAVPQWRKPPTINLSLR